MAIKFLLLIVSVLFPLNIVFKEKPASCQLYGRNEANIGFVKIRGALLDTAVDTLSAVVLRNGRPYSRTAVPAIFIRDTAAFDFSLPIDAELVEYSLLFYADTTLAVRADSLVAGDAVLVNGQSNAWTLTPGEVHEFVRTWSVNQRKWIIAEKGLTGSSYETGVWGQQLGHRINLEQGVPAAVFNGAESSMPLAVFVPPSSNYTRVRNQIDSARLRNNIQAVFFYQGEANSNGPQPADTAQAYPAQFKLLYQSWKRDYSPVKKVYVVQLGDWEASPGKSAWTRNIREIQRNLPLTCPDVRLMPASGNTNHWNWEGYTKLGDRLYRLMARDVYRCSDTNGINPPNIKRAYYSSPNKDRITLVFDQPTFFRDSLGHALKKYFALDSAYDVVDTAWHEPDYNRIILKLKAPSAATKITYLTGSYYLPGDTIGTQTGSDKLYRGPFLYNSRRVPGLSFHEVPVGNAQASDTAQTVSLDLTAPKTNLLRFESVPMNALVTRAGGTTDTNLGVAFRSLDTFVVRVDAHGRTRGFNAGQGRAVAIRDGKADTLTFTVGSGMRPLSGLSFAKRSKGQLTLTVGDSLAIGLTGLVLENGDSLGFNMDSLAALNFPPANFQPGSGYLRAVQAGAGLPVSAEASGFRCSTFVTIVSPPSFLRRINFQGANAAYSSIPGWTFETGGAYSASRGYGWQGAGITGGTVDSLEEFNYFKNTYLKTPLPGNTFTGVTYRVDAPAGSYILRITNYNPNACHSNAYILLGSDTIINNSYCTYSNHRYFESLTEKITISGDSGLILKVYGGICYLVLMADDGSDINLAARDYITAPSSKQGGTETETATDDWGRVLNDVPVACPNPFNPSTLVRFGLPSHVAATYGIFNVRGQCVRSFKFLAGEHARSQSLTLGRETFRGSASGVYFGRLIRSDSKVFCHKLMMIK